MGTVVNVRDAKTHLSGLLARVEAGEEILIGRVGKPVARLVPVAPKGWKRTPASAKGQIVIAPDFDEPLPEDILRDFVLGSRP